MVLPGFEISENIVGVRLSFDAIRLEDRFDTPTKLRATDNTRDHIRETIEEYCEQKPEICNAHYGGISFSLIVYEDDIDVVARLFASALEFERHEIPNISTSLRDEEVETVTYKNIVQIDSSDLGIEDVSWEELSDVSVDVDAAIQHATPVGHDHEDFSTESFREFMYDYVKPAVDTSGWRGGNSWLINMAISELRNGNYQEASYAFEGARLGLTKAPIFEGEAPLHQYFNNCLISLRQLCAYHDSPEDRQREHELFISMDDRSFVFVPKFLSKPSIDDKNFRFSNTIWIANALVLVAAVANAMDPPTISRSEVDPFGTDKTAKNNQFVLKVAQRLFEIDEYDDMEDWSANQEGQHLPYLQTIDFAKLSPEIIVTKMFSEAGFSIQNYGAQALIYGDNEELDISYDSLLSRNDQFYLVKLVDGGAIEFADINAFADKVGDFSEDITLFLLSEREYPEIVVDAAEELDGIDLYYIDISNESIQSIHSSGVHYTRSLETSSDTLEELAELYAAAESENNSQEKGDLLEELMRLVFDQLIPDTDVIDMNVRTASEEIDLILRNREITHPWKTLGTPIYVECKNWSSPAGTSIVKVLRGGMESIGPMCETGILVSWEGISDGNPRRDAGQKVREYRQKNVKILVLDKDDIYDIVDTGDVKRVFEEKHKELITR